MWKQQRDRFSSSLVYVEYASLLVSKKICPTLPIFTRSRWRKPSKLAVACKNCVNVYIWKQFRKKYKNHILRFRGLDFARRDGKNTKSKTSRSTEDVAQIFSAPNDPNWTAITNRTHSTQQTFSLEISQWDKWIIQMSWLHT